ncbi:MAG: bifunctional diguanylate cyclase/phosphodiesterase [Marinibacterium sp.]|nr:bifunctional diguanylate cyclase/phosphodiesterase [Marinibacterium sp.]
MTTRAWFGGLFRPARSLCTRLLTGPPALAFLPALTLAGYWVGGEQALMVLALGLPLTVALVHVLAAPGPGPVTTTARDQITGLMLRDDFEQAVSRIWAETDGTGLNSACFLLDLDDLQTLADRHGQSAADTMAERTADRLISALRDGDVIARLGDHRFAICLKPVQQLDLETCIQLAGRVQAAVEDPVSVGGLGLYLSCTIGFCARARVDGSAEDWLAAAGSALSEATGHGPSTIRAYSEELRKRRRTRSDLRADAAKAIADGQIQPWFQPQISTDTGRVTGFEALARWMHPVHGLIPPNVFLPLMDEAGLSEQLCETILFQSLMALQNWDAQGIDVPTVGVNFSDDELRNPQLVDKIAWQLDRFGISPDRLSVEILETVVSAGPDDMATRNIRALAKLGCRIDLDDFGTGNASIAAIKRFQIHRIKIDRSFVTHADRDPEQQKLVTAVLTMSEQLGLDTLAEGVETAGEHTLLSQLGCGHVQGFGIARPMPFDETLDWMHGHNRKLPDPQSIERRIG